MLVSSFFCELCGKASFYLQPSFSQRKGKRLYTITPKEGRIAIARNLTADNEFNAEPFQSTHLRATCNFKTDGLVTTDYLRAKTTGLNILKVEGTPCVKMEYINVRGYDCYNCTALIVQRTNNHLQINSYYGATVCQFTSAGNGSIASDAGEDTFWRML